MLIDIRQEQPKKITAIKVLDKLGGTARVTTITKESVGTNRVCICGHLNKPGVYTGNEPAVHIQGEEEARNLIKALEKAIELGWF